jgi:hypothetical protein
LHVDISTPEGIDKARNMGLFSTKCPLFVADAVEFIEKTVEKNSL